MMHDGLLLRSYADDDSDEAFVELVCRHLHLVYFTALRQLGGDTQLARDAAQAVFVALARNARSLAGRHSISGWLHARARSLAAKIRAAEARRGRPEEPPLGKFSKNPNDWYETEPVLDRALGRLSAADREALLVRYFQGCSLVEVSQTLGWSEDQTRLRVGKALNKLRLRLARGGREATGADLALALANQASSTAPAGLLDEVTSAALTSGAATRRTLRFRIARVCTPKRILAAGFVAGLILLGWELYVDRIPRAAVAQAENDSQEIAALQQENSHLGEIAATAADLRRDQTDLARLRALVEGLRLRSSIVAGSDLATVTVKRDGSLVWNGMPISSLELEKNLEEFRARHPEKSARLVVRAEGTKFEWLANVFQLASRVGFKNMRFDPSVKPPTSD
jgi:RNA polymerase sigma factor (sigma-70 family)